MKRGFTLIELLIVIAIIGILSSVVLGAVNTAREKAYISRTKEEFKSFTQALELYASDNGGDYPPDASRNIPPGLEPYLASNSSSVWPAAPWPDTVYDWDNWDDPDTGDKIYQISVRFCPADGNLASCHFPKEPWASNFGVDSAYYYCVYGNCRSHVNQPYNYPGYCSNCTTQPSGN
jgi:prepilin-type N-terminal cleavage/methylation domain-containing protein